MQGYLDRRRRNLLEAAVDRIFPPGDGPGGRELGAAEAIDRLLAGQVVPPTLWGRPPELLKGRRTEAWQRRITALRDRYREGLDDLDRRAQSRFGAGFADLSSGDQDAVLSELELELSPEPRETIVQQMPTAEDSLPFLRVLILHTRQGCYGDPAYGGNRGGAGWRLLGFPGPPGSEGHQAR